MTMTAMFLIAVTSATLSAAPSPGQREHVRVYVYTTPSASGQHTDEEKGRLEAVDELRSALKKKKGLAIVEDRSQADVLVEVVEREQREAPLGGFGGKTITPMGDTIIRVHVVSGADQADLKGIGQGTWGRAAKDAADRITKWIARKETKVPHSLGIESPPSTLMMEPVAYGASPRSSAATTRPTSSGCPQRRSGTRPSAIRLS